MIILRKYEFIKSSGFAFLLWLIIFIMALFIYNLGFDLTDEGWQLSKSWGMFHGDFKNNADLIWGSSFINGIWMLLKNKPLLYFTRIGFLLFLPLCSVVIFLILKEYFRQKWVFFSVLVSFIIFGRTFLIYSTVNYYYLPVFASLISFWFIVKFEKSEISPLKYLIFSGIFAGTSIHLKFTYLLIIPVFIIYFFAFCDRNDRLKYSMYFFSSLISVLFLGFIILIIAGGAVDLVYEHGRLSLLDMFGSFFGTTSVNSSLNYSAGNLINIYMKDLFSVLNHSVIPLLLLLITAYLSYFSRVIKYIAILLSGIILYFYIYIQPSESHYKIIAVCLAASSVVFLFSQDQKKLLFLNFIFLSIFALSFLGSGTGFYSGIFSLGFAGFSSLAISSSYECVSDKINSRIILPVFILIAVMILSFRNYTPYRDLPSPYLNTMFRSPELYGIYSFKERVEGVDEFMAFAKSENIKSQKVIFVAMPMFYYLLDINPVISETHDMILGFDQLKKEVAESEPDVIVVPVQSPRGQFWPLEQNKDNWKKDGFERQTAHYYKFYNDFIVQNNFQKIFENSMFRVYSKTGRNSEENK